MASKRPIDEPSTSTGKRKRKQRFTVQEVIDNLREYDSEEGEFGQEYMLSDDSDVDFVVEEEYRDSDDSDDETITSRASVEERGSGPRPSDHGDASTIDEGWSTDFEPPSFDMTSFNKDNLGPVNIPDHISAESLPIDFLSLFLKDDFWQNLTAMTNLRARQMKVERPTYYYCRNYKDASVEEMKAFFGLRLYMEYICVKPSYKDYWTSDGKDFIGHTPGFRTVMTRDRFLALWSFLHVVDEQDESLDKADRIYKVRPLLNYLLPLFLHYYQPMQFLSLDEGMIPTKNRLAIKQYIKDKPTKWGIKSFMLCEADSGYIINAEIYTGAAEMPVPELGVVGNTVVRLVAGAGIENKAHILVMDRFYNSVTLAKYALSELHTGVVGTLLQNRKFFPMALKKVKKLPRGGSRYLCQGSITCMVWQDNRPITFISNFHDPKEGGVVSRRKKDGTALDIDMPKLVQEYNKFMGGCDKNDQMTRLHRSRRHYRWPRRLMLKFLMWACYNSFVLFLAHHTGPKPPLHFTRYIQRICWQLVGNYRSTAIRRGQLEPAEQRLTQGNHFPVVPTGSSSDHVCAVCMKKHLKYQSQNPGVAYKDNPHKKVKTRFWCTLCKKYLCIKEGSTCWEDWHTKVEYWR